MRYFLKKSTPSRKGVYLQIYQSSYIPGKGSRNRSYEALGYVSDLLAEGISDPEGYARERVDRLNAGIPSRKEAKIGEYPDSLNLGHFLLRSMIDYLDLDGTLGLMSANKRFSFRLSDFLRSMIYAQVVNPCSKHMVVSMQN